RWRFSVVHIGHLLHRCPVTNHTRSSRIKPDPLIDSYDSQSPRTDTETPRSVRKSMNETSNPAENFRPSNPFSNSRNRSSGVIFMPWEEPPGRGTRFGPFRDIQSRGRYRYSGIQSLRPRRESILTPQMDHR